MAGTLKIDGYDFFRWTRLPEEDGFDPVGEGFLQPQFAEGSLSDGAPLISLSENNRELTWPLILDPAKDGAYANTKAGLHQLIRDINRRLRIAQQLEWADDGISSSSFAEIEFARFDAAYGYRRGVHKLCKGVLRIWTRTYAHTGTYRLVASAAGSGVAVTLSPTTLDGDALAHLQTRVTGGSQQAQPGRLTGYALVPSGRAAFIPAASLSLAAADPGATLMSRSDAIASQIVLGPSHVTGEPLADREVGRFSVNASQYAGRQRLLMVGAGRQTSAWVETDDGQATDPAAIDSLRTMGYGTIDLGSVDIDPTHGATRTLVVKTRATGYSVIPQGFESRRRIEVNGLLMLPDDGDAGLTVEDNRAWLAADRLDTSVSTETPVDGTTDLLGGEYDLLGSMKHAFGQAGICPSGLANATGVGVVGSMSEHGDTIHELQLDMATISIASSWVAVGKSMNATSRVAGPLFYGLARNTATFGTLLQLALFFVPTSGSASLVASTAARTPQSGTSIIRLRNTGPQVSLTLIDDRGVPQPTVYASLGASAAVAATYGRMWFGMFATSGSDGQDRITALRAWSAASGAAPCDTILFDTSIGRVTRNAASGGQVAELTGALRGDAAKLDPALAQQVVAFSLPVSEQPTTDLLNADVRALERFTYAR